MRKNPRQITYTHRERHAHMQTRAHIRTNLQLFALVILHGTIQDVGDPTGADDSTGPEPMQEDSSQETAILFWSHYYYEALLFKLTDFQRSIFRSAAYSGLRLGQKSAFFHWRTKKNEQDGIGGLW